MARRIVWMNMKRAMIWGLLLGAMMGCNSYRITQTSSFVNDDGEILRVDYGRAERNHTNTFISPANGKELEFSSRLVVEVTMPDGDSFTAWQCMNLNLDNHGTMYKTDNGEWYFLANGFTCRVAQRDERYNTGYREAFVGVLCNTPMKAMEPKDNKWKKAKRVDKAFRESN